MVMSLLCLLGTDLSKALLAILNADNALGDVYLLSLKADNLK